MSRSIRACTIWGAAICLLFTSGASAQQDPGAPGQYGRTITIQGPGLFIGVTVSDLESADTNASAGGVLITAISPDSPAALAGLQVSDVVVEFDGERVRGARQFARLVEETAAGRQARLSVVRSGNEQNVTITLADSAPGTTGLSRRRTDSVRFLGPQPQLWVNGVPRLGVTLMNMTKLLAHYYNAAAGVIVSAVVDGSPAARAGMQVGDVILAVDGLGIGSQTDLTYVLRGATGSLTLDIIRDKRALTVTISPVAPMKAGTGWIL
jgi:serine protease Do